VEGQRLGERVDEVGEQIKACIGEVFSRIVELSESVMATSILKSGFDLRQANQVKSVSQKRDVVSSCG
jgi:hypothetical protein